MEINFDIKKLKVVSIDEIRPNTWNPKPKGGNDFEKVKKSIEKKGLRGFIVVRENEGYEIIDGEQRWTSCKELDFAKVLIYNEGEVSDKEAKELTIWWQQQVPFDHLDLSYMISEMQETFGELELPYSEDEIDEMLKISNFDFEQYSTERPSDDIDDIPTTPKTSITKLGDLWLLGNHRVLCGDSTDKTTVERLMDGKKADMVFTDPPYGMNLDTDYSKLPSTKATGNKTHKAVIGDDKPFDYQLFAWLQQPEQIWFGANYYAKTLPDCGSWLVWDKRVEEKFDKMFGSGFEIAWSKTRHKQKIYRHNNTLFGGDTEARGKEHPTQKPTKLCIEMIDDIKDIKSVLDPFLGSGSTLIACEQTDRICYGMELDPQYVDVICKRYQLLTGELPILESTGDAHNFADDVQ